MCNERMGARSSRHRLFGVFMVVLAACLYSSYMMTSSFIYYENKCHYESPSKVVTKRAIKLAMTIHPVGRLGNLMGEYATLYGLSRLNGYQPVLKPKMDYTLRNYFSLSIPTLDAQVGRRIPWELHMLNDWMEPSYSQFNKTFVMLGGYPCSWTFYHQFREEILREFAFFPSIIRDVQDFLHKAKGSGQKIVTYVGVHVRRGDYVKLMREHYDGVLADSNYLLAAMDEYRKRYSATLFIISSDDLSWCQTNINVDREDIILAWNGSSSDPGRDMALLSQCNHSIMTIGTFGYWASYLAGGDVIYLSNFTRPGSVFNNVFRPDAWFLPQWTGMSANLNSTGWF